MKFNEDITIVHLCVDPQIGFISKRRKKYYPAILREFADQIYPIPTIWIGKFIGIGGNTTYARPSHRFYGNLKKSLNFLVDIKDDEDIFAKNTVGAFDFQFLGEELRLSYPKLDTVIITGVYTRHCVDSTMSGALREGFKCIALYDLMGDKVFLDRLPIWHYMQFKNARSFPKLAIINKQECIELLKTNRFGISERLALPAPKKLISVIKSSLFQSLTVNARHANLFEL